MIRKPAPALPVPAVPPHPDAVLTPAQCASWLQIDRRQLQRVGVPHMKISHKIRRYKASAVSAWLDRRAQNPSATVPDSPARLT